MCYFSVSLSFLSLVLSVFNCGKAYYEIGVFSNWTPPVYLITPYSSKFSCRALLEEGTCLSSDFPLRPFYIPPDHDSFVCSQPHSSGMTKCSEIPKLRKGNLTCEFDAATYNAQVANDSSKATSICINWNQYYKFCNVSDKNPFSGSISFDNIGLAWVAIFQVRSISDALIWSFPLPCRSSVWRVGWTSCTIFKMLIHSGIGFILCVWLLLAHFLWSIYVLLSSPPSLVRQRSVKPSEC